MAVEERETNMDRTIALQFGFRTIRNAVFDREECPSDIMSISDDFTQAEFAAKYISSKSPIKPRWRSYWDQGWEDLPTR